MNKRTFYNGRAQANVCTMTEKERARESLCWPTWISRSLAKKCSWLLSLFLYFLLYCLLSTTAHHQWQFDPTTPLAMPGCSRRFVHPIFTLVPSTLARFCWLCRDISFFFIRWLLYKYLLYILRWNTFFFCQCYNDVLNNTLFIIIQ